MNRREALLGISALAGHALFPTVLERFAAAAAPAAAAAAAGDADWRPALVSAAEGRALAAVVDTIIPATDTPEARAARVHVFVDLALAHCVPPAQQHAVRAALAALAATPFADDEGAAAREHRLARVARPALDLLTELTVLGYFTSQIGATQALAYEAVPGRWQGCAPLAPGQKAWAT